MAMRKDLHIKVILLFLAVAFIFSCSPKSDYKTLSFFFDGVPDPDKQDSIAQADSIRLAERQELTFTKVVKTEFVLHPPYQEKECENCHDKGQMGKLLEPLPGLCYQCHESFGDQYKVVHGPVDAGFCIKCHSPHMSKNDFMLLRTGQDLCLDCHMAKDVFKNEVHADIEDANCTECHNPHGGDDRFMFN